MTLSWQQAKVTSYFLQVHFALAELLYGKTNVPVGVRPTEPTPPSQGEKADPMAQTVYEMLKRIYDEWIAQQ
jgi:hypothetical protein